MGPALLVMRLLSVLIDREAAPPWQPSEPAPLEPLLEARGYRDSLRAAPQLAPRSNLAAAEAVINSRPYIIGWFVWTIGCAILYRHSPVGAVFVALAGLYLLLLICLAFTKRRAGVRREG